MPHSKLIKNYLSNRRMYVTMKGTNSTTKEVKTGLGPTLYNIYTNDIPHTNSTHIAIYADDMAIYTFSWSIKQATKYIQQHIDHNTHAKMETQYPQKTQAITFIR